MTLSRSIAALITSFVLASPASACMCFPSPLCHEITTFSPSSNSIFVARVIDVWPARQTLASNYTSQRSLAQTKQLILRRWHTILSANEKRQIRLATNESAIIHTFLSLQRVRVIVTESLLGPKLQEIYTATTSCGYRFQPGLTYLVDAYLDSNHRFSVHACSQTRTVDTAQALDDINMLRALRDGHPPAPRIYGRLSPNHLQPDTIFSPTVGISPVHQ